MVREWRAAELNDSCSIVSCRGQGHLTWSTREFFSDKFFVEWGRSVGRTRR